MLAKGGFTIGAPVKLTVQTSDPGGPLPLMEGEITAVECELDATGTFTEVRGLRPGAPAASAGGGWRRTRT